MSSPSAEWTSGGQNFSISRDQGGGGGGGGKVDISNKRRERSLASISMLIQRMRCAGWA